MASLQFAFEPNEVLLKARSKMYIKQFLCTLIEATYYIRHFLEKGKEEGPVADWPNFKVGVSHNVKP